MQTVRISNLNEGDRFEQALFLPSGQKLLTPGVSLSRRHLQMLSRQAVTELILADSLDELAEAGVLARYDMSQVRVGQVAEQDLIAPGGALLVEQGQAFEDHHLASLADGGFVTKGSGKSETTTRRDRMLMADLAVQQLEEALPQLELRVRPEQLEIWDMHNVNDRIWPSQRVVRAKRDGIVDELQRLYTEIAAGHQVQVNAFTVMVEDLLDDLLNHRQQFPQLALMCRRQEDYLPDHAFTVAVLAMAIAAQMTWSREHVRLMGLASLVFDLGMLQVPKRIRIGSGELSDIDRNMVHRHPVFGLLQLELIEGEPTLIKLMAYQHHERENGSGYPCGIRGDRICDFARVLAVADAFAAQTAPRSFRKMKLPYVAMEEMIRAAASNEFYKPAVRALVQAAGLFPVGSYVKLSNGKYAHIIAGNPNHLDRPVVQILNRDATRIGEPVDLSRMSPEMLSVVRPVPGLDETEPHE